MSGSERFELEQHELSKLLPTSESSQKEKTEAEAD